MSVRRPRGSSTHVARQAVEILRGSSTQLQAVRLRDQTTPTRERTPGKITYLEGKVMKVPCRMANTLVISIPGFDNTPWSGAEGRLDARGRRRGG